MNRFAAKLMKRNYARRFVTLAAVALALLLLTAVLTPLLLRRQISAAVDAAVAEERTDTAENTAGAGDAGSTETTVPAHKKEGDAHKAKAILRALPEVSVAARILLPLCVVALAVVAVLFRVTEAEWLWRGAAAKKMNRALWPILGALLGVPVVLVFLIIINDPRRMAKQA